MAIYLQGCAGNINPVFVDHTWRECQRIGAIVGATATKAALELMTLPSGLRSINLSWDEEVPVDPPIVGRVVEPADLATLTLTVPVEPRRWRPPAAIAEEAADVQAQLARTASPALRRALLPRVNELWVEGLLASGDDLTDSMDVPSPVATGTIEIQGFRLGRELALVGLPGEPFVETGLAIMQSGGDVLVGGYTNGAAGYLPTSEAFAERGYEVGCTLYAPGTAEAIAAAARTVVERLKQR